MYRLQGLDCAGCAAKIEASLQRELDPEASVSFATLTLMIDPSQIIAAQEIIDRIEPGVTIISPTEASTPSQRSLSGVNATNGTHHGEQGHGHDHAHGAQEGVKLWPLISAGTLFSLGLIFRGQLASITNGWGEYLVFITAYLLVGRNVIITAIRNATRGQIFDENFLMTIATIGAFAIGNFPEAVGVMLFYYVGELLQDMAVTRSRGSIKELLDIRPDTAHLVTGTGSIDVNPMEVQIGDTILIRPGERVPLDGRIIEGESFVDTSALTGESVPRRVAPGKTILAGMINSSGLLQVQVTKAYGETALARILELVENAASRKAPTEQFITKFARYYTPAVVFSAALVAVVPPLILPGAIFRDWLHRALVLLVISCPCALVISIPLGYFGGIGGASRQGILVKGANYLEALADVDTVVFDKTGTLTEGVFEVQRILPADGFSPEAVLDLAAQAEVHSSHPIALSILQAAGDKEFTEEGEFQEIPGKGMRIVVHGSEILVGNAKLLTSHGIDFAPPASQGATMVHVAKDRQYAGSITIADSIKTDAPNALHKLWHLNVKETAMLTGDALSTARQVGETLGIDTIRAELLPHDKVAEIESLLATKGTRGKLAFVGDGINDAPVLTRADVGIAMGGLGSDAAIEAADVVIMEDRLEKVGEAIEMARYTRRIIIQNIVMAFGVKAIFIILGIFGVATLWEAVFADVGVALLAVMNSTRALRFEPSSQQVCSSTCLYKHRQAQMAG
ncbi:MAG: cadmium-translocating P-type ATPase [Firmicutes bacterium]|nr:cadmium-translocating P-type ATPase [Bacillota bacterium]